MAPLEPGSTLAHYRILEKLGQGGQATAYKAEDLRLSRRPVVIKALRPELATSESARRRFEREACLCSALEHPNVCSIYDVGDSDGLAYIVMQFVEGRTLKQLVGGRPLELVSALSIAIQIADALAVAHASGIVHRDIKPGNVMVTAGGQAKVLDFGLAKMLASDAASAPGPSDDPVTEIGVPYGSVGYGSPEQALGERVDHRTDVFSLGVVLHEMTTGQAPFRGRNRIEVLHAVIHQAARPLAAINPRAAPLQPILDRALAKDPRARYQTMAAMRDELKALMRRLAHETGLVPTEAGATLVVPQRARGRWLLGGGLGRFLRFRSAPRADDGARAEPYRPPSWGTETKTTIAVLPFTNLAQDPVASFYEFALADGIITQLGRIKSLVVRPSSYVAGYTGQQPDPHRVGVDLAVGFVLTGGFLRSRERVRITAQLVATDTGAIEWSDTIDIPAGDLIAIQDTITERLVARLELDISREEQRQVERPPTRSNEAFEFYLRGRDQLIRYAAQSLDHAALEGALTLFNEAAGLDPEFAGAHAALSRCYILQAQSYGGGELYTLAERSARRALELDAAHTEARLQLALIDLHHGDKARAEESLVTLRAEAPNDPAVVLVSAMLYRLSGLYDEALAQYDRLLEINPQDVVVVSYNRARVYIHQRDYERALAELGRARAAEPEHPLVKIFAAIAFFNQGRIEEAQTLVEDVQRQIPQYEAAAPILAWCWSARGAHARARSLIGERVKQVAAADPDIALWLASLYAMEGVADEAIEWLRRAVRLGNENYPLLSASPKLDNLRRDPRFVEILDELRRAWRLRRGEAAAGDASA